MKKGNKDFLLSKTAQYLLPSVSLDCVILCYHEGEIKILLNKFKMHENWMLPGGFVNIDEDLDNAAHRILKERTNLTNCSLKQFYTFGDKNRINIDENKILLDKYSIQNEEQHWFLRRFISIGYYAFVMYDKVDLKKQSDDLCEWVDINDIPALYGDHNKIVNKAIDYLRVMINYFPFVLELLPDKFTMTELRVIYEKVLGRKIDRKNFQRKMLSYGLVDKLDILFKKKGIKETTLYSFNKERFLYVLENGLSTF